MLIPIGYWILVANIIVQKDNISKNYILNKKLLTLESVNHRAGTQIATLVSMQWPKSSHKIKMGYQISAFIHSLE